MRTSSTRARESVQFSLLRSQEISPPCPAFSRTLCLYSVEWGAHLAPKLTAGLAQGVARDDAQASAITIGREARSDSRWDDAPSRRAPTAAPRFPSGSA